MLTPRVKLTFLLLLVLSLALWIVGACIGSSGFENTIGQFWAPGSASDQALALQIVWDIRLPRTLGAWLAGGLLGLSGALAQGLFRNPLADPYLLGSAAGASLGVALMLALMGGAAGLLGVDTTATLNAINLTTNNGWVRMGLTGAAFVGAVVAVLLTLTLAKGVQHTLRLLLAGVIVGVILGALSSLVMLFSPESLQAMQVFMLGSTAFVSWSACWLMVLVWLPSLLISWSFSRLLDGLSLGEATAISLGLPLATLRTLMIGLLALTTATAVAQTGLIAFVGLAAPHLVRAITKSTHGQLLVLSSLAGGTLLTAADLLARALVAPQELPVGVLTAVLGGGYLLVLMHRGQAIKRGTR